MGLPKSAETSILLVVAAALVSADNRIFVQQRAAQSQHGGLWEFPGGKVEHGETPAAALARELDEELGIDVFTEAMQPISFATEPQGGRQLVLLLYLINAWHGEPRALTAAGAKWVSVDSLRALPMPPADRPLVQVLARELSTSRQA